MNDSLHPLNTLYTIAINAALEAGAAIASIYNRGFQVRYKEDQSPLTEADLASHNCIKNKLAGCGLPLLSEEGNIPSWEQRKSWNRYWLIDPLDGTKEFVKRNGEFTVNIALMEKDFPIFGVIYIPVSRELYFGSQQTGSYRMILEDEKPLVKINGFEEWKIAATRLPVPRNTKDIWLMLSRSHVSEKTGVWLKQIEKHFGSIKTLNVGSSIKFCRMAEGMVQLYPRFSPTMLWDTAAGQAIAEGAGMAVISLSDKKRLAYHREELRNPDFVAFDSRFISVELLKDL